MLIERLDLMRAIYLTKDALWVYISRAFFNELYRVKEEPLVRLINNSYTFMGIYLLVKDGDGYDFKIVVS